MKNEKTREKAKTGPLGERNRATMRYSVMEGAAWSAMYGFGETYLAPFALALGASVAQLGLLSGIQQLSWSVSQQVSSRLLVRVRSRLAILKPFALLNALVWPLLICLALLFPLAGDQRILALIGIVCAYSFFGGMCTPSWVSLMGDVVPEKVRGKYFGSRNRYCDSVTLFSIIAAGWVLGLFKDALAGFALLFLVAFLGRFTSFSLFFKHQEPRYRHAEPATAGRWPAGFGKYLAFSGVFVFGCNLAGAVTAFYLLNQLGFGYFTYSLLMAAWWCARIISMPHWGKLGDRFGNRTLIAGACLLIVFQSVLWFLGTDPLLMLAIYVISGFLYAGYDLSAFNYILDSTVQGDRVKSVADLNLANGIAAFSGAALGGLAAVWASEPVVFGLSGVLFVFLLSTIVRLAAAVLLAPGIPDVKPGEPIAEREFAMRALTVYPAGMVREELAWVWGRAASIRDTVRRGAKGVIGAGRKRL